MIDYPVLVTDDGAYYVILSGGGGLPGPPGSGSSVNVTDESTALGAFSNLTFSGVGVKATDGGSGNANVVVSGTLTPFAEMFGAVGDGVADDGAKLNAFLSYVETNKIADHDGSGTFGTSSTITIGPASAPSVITPLALRGSMNLNMLSPVNEAVRLRHLRYRDATGLNINATGAGSGTFSTRTSLIAFYFEDCGRQSFGKFQATNFALANCWWGTVNNNLASVESIVGANIGSGRAGQSLTGAWSSPANSGSSGSTGQFTTLSLSALPSAAILSYMSIGTEPLQIRLNGVPGALYYVLSLNTGTGVATVYPWIDPALGTSGTFEWCFGGNHCTRSSDSNLIEVGILDSFGCGRALSDASLYGSRIRNMQSSACGTEICLGKAPGSAFFGTKIDDRYPEGGGSLAHEQIAAISRFGSTFYHLMLGESGSTDLTRCFALGDPRLTSGVIQGGEFGIQGQGSITLTDRGRILQYHKSNLNRPLASTISLFGQRREPRVEEYFSNGPTFALTVQGSGEYNRLMGYTGSFVLVHGTGANGAPTGTITFNPPTGGTINGGAANAAVAFSGLTKPTLFMYQHTDTAQLTWRVWPL